MKKYLLVCMAILLSFCIVGCQKQTNVKEKIEKVDSDKTGEPEKKTEDEKKKDEHYEHMANQDQNLDVQDITGEYEIVIYTISDTTIEKGTESWIDLFGEETEENDDSNTISLTIKEKNIIVFNIYGKVYESEYLLEGNVMKWISAVEDDEDEVSVTKALFVDDCLVVDLNGSKMYFAKKDDPEGIQKAESVCQRIDSGEFEDEEEIIQENTEEENKEDEN